MIAARDALATAVVLLAAAPLFVLPSRAAVALGRAYGTLGMVVWPAGRRAGMMNLRRAYGPSMTKPRARACTRAIFANLGASVAEALRLLPRLRRDASGWEAIYEPADAALEARIIADPRPKVFVTGHLGSWEVTILLGARRVGHRGAVVARAIDNRFLDALVRRVRFGSASRWIEKRGAAAQALLRLRAGESIAMLADENAGPRGVFVDFFGRPASTARLPALLSLLCGAPIVVAAAIRQPDRPKYLLRLALLEPPDRGLDAVTRLTQQIAATFEAWVRETPLQWRWVHWRWKTRPDGPEERYGRRELDACFREDGGDGLEPVRLHE
jgi:KDO2-lipid IV(A) lauroyltransferase